MPESRHRGHGRRSPKGLPLVSACLIVRDEENFLPRCLTSARALTDDIVVVDTGSRDRTIEFARDFGARVYEFPWRDDFSAARNFAIDRARGTWILTIDADEELPHDLVEQLRSELLGAPPDVAGYSLRIDNVRGLDDHRILDSGRAVRLFRNVPQHRYVSPIHEQIVPSLVKTGRVALSGAHLLHYGYMGEVVQGKDKIARNLRLLEAALQKAPQEDPFRGYLLMQIGREHQRRRDPAEADRFLSEAVRITEATADQHLSPHYFTLASYYAANLLELGRPAEAAEFARRAVQRIPQSSEVWFYLGVAELQLEQNAIGITHLLWATALAEVRKKDQEFYAPSRSIVAWCNASIALMKLGAPEAALQILLTALADAPDDASLRDNLLTVLHQRATVVVLFAQKAPPELVRELLMASFLAGDEGLLLTLAEAVLRGGSVALGRFWQAAACLARRDDAQALALLQEVPLEGDIGGWAQIGRVLALTRLGRRQEVERFLAGASRDNFHTLLREVSGLAVTDAPSGYPQYRTSFLSLLRRWHVTDSTEAPDHAV